MLSSLSFPPTIANTTNQQKQKGRGSAPERKVVVNRPLPFSGVGSAATAASASCSGGEEPEKSRRRRRRRRHRSTSGADSHDDDDDDGGGGIVLAQAQAMQAFRFLCRSGQLFLAEQLALSGVWDAGKTESGGGVGGGEDRNTGNNRGVGRVGCLASKDTAKEPRALVEAVAFSEKVLRQ